MATFDSHPKSKFWSKRNTLKPNQLALNSHKKCWFDCACGHEFDFVIEDRKIIIELDGKQHFEQIGKWQSPEKNREIDIYKMKCANENGFSIIRILQKDVYNNKYNWLDELCENIENNK